MEELSLDDLAQGIQKTMEGPKSEILLFATSQAIVTGFSGCLYGCRT